MSPRPSRTHGGLRAVYRCRPSTCTWIPTQGKGRGAAPSSPAATPHSPRATGGSKPSPSRDGNRLCTWPGPTGTTEETRPSFEVTVFSEDGRVVARLPRQLLPEGDPASWGYAVALLSQEGFPSPGVRRVRDVSAEASQFRIGGGAGGVNDTRILDVATPEEGAQEDGLTVPPVSTGSADDLSVDQLGSVPVIEAG